MNSESSLTKVNVVADDAKSLESKVSILIITIMVRTASTVVTHGTLETLSLKRRIYGML